MINIFSKSNINFCNYILIKLKMAVTINDTFLDAIKTNKFDVVKTLIAIKDNIGLDINAKDYGGWTSLMWASADGHKELVELLLAKRAEGEPAEIEAKNLIGWNSLLLASRNGHKEIVELLLKNGADINAKDSYGWTALMFASNFCHTEIVKILEDFAAKSYIIRVPPGVSPKIVFDATATEVTVDISAN
jgi:ankyrin repeat protein